MATSYSRPMGVTDAYWAKTVEALSAPPSGSITSSPTSGYRQDSGDPYTMVNGAPNTNVDSGGTFYNPNQNRPAPAPTTSSLTALQSAAAAPAGAGSAVGAGAAGATVPTPPPVTSGFGDGGMPSMDSGIDRILGAAGGGGMNSVNGLMRAGLGQRSRPMDSYVLAGRKVY
jgi:hypothetical protein